MVKLVFLWVFVSPGAWLGQYVLLPIKPYSSVHRIPFSVGWFLHPFTDASLLNNCPCVSHFPLFNCLFALFIFAFFMTAAKGSLMLCLCPLLLLASTYLSPANIGMQLCHISFTNAYTIGYSHPSFCFWVFISHFLTLTLALCLHSYN